MSYEVLTAVGAETGHASIHKWTGDIESLKADIRSLGGEITRIVEGVNDINPSIFIKCNRNADEFLDLLKAKQMQDPAHFTRLTQYYWEKSQETK